MGRKVKVVTKCGEIHHYEYGQEVDTVEIVESPKFRDLAVLDDLREKFNELCDGKPCTPCPLFDKDHIPCPWDVIQRLPAYQEIS